MPGCWEEGGSCPGCTVSSQTKQKAPSFTAGEGLEIGNVVLCALGAGMAISAEQHSPPSCWLFQFGAASEGPE